MNRPPTGDSHAITPRQRQILDFIHGHTRDHGMPPTVREIARAVGFSSTNAVAEQLDRLVKRGFLDRAPRKSRGLVPAPGSDLHLRVPILGRIAAGRPIYAEENIEGYIEADHFMLRETSGTFVLRVTGDSMTGVGIMDGDYIIVRRQPDAERGRIVVALIDDEATVKLYEPGDGRVTLVAANPAYAPIEVSEGDGTRFDLIGVVTGVFRRY